MANTLRVHARVDARGLIDDLESVQLGLGKEVNAAIREAGQVVLHAVPRFTPYDSHHRALRRDKDGNQFTQVHLRESFELRPGGQGAAVIASSHPAAGVTEFGGSISPKGTPIRIREAAMALKAGEAEAGRFEADLARRIDALTARHGL